MADILLDLDPLSSGYGDIVVADNDLRLNDGITAIRQHILQRLRFYFGEWFLDISLGVPYFQQILVKNPDQGKIDALFIDTIIGTPGVEKLTKFSFQTNFQNRNPTVSFTAQTTKGVVSYNGLL